MRAHAIIDPPQTAMLSTSSTKICHKALPSIDIVGNAHRRCIEERVVEKRQSEIAVDQRVEAIQADRKQEASKTRALTLELGYGEFFGRSSLSNFPR